MFGTKGGTSTYRQVGLDEFSSDDDNDDFDVETNRVGRGRGNHPRNHNGASPPSSDNDYAANSLQRQQELMQQQDQGLEMLSQSAERLGQMSMAISEELGQQNMMLDEMDADLDQAGENLDYVTKKTKEFIDKAGGTKNCILIAGLSGVVILLLILIIYF